MQQMTLWDNENTYKHFDRKNLQSPNHSCPGCGAPPGEWQYAQRFAWLTGTIGICDDCASIPEVVREIVRQDRPPDDTPCTHPAGSAEKVAWMAARFQEGRCLFHQDDNPLVLLPQVVGGQPDHVNPVGQTGVERCGERWRVRPFYRGRKWFWGIFDTELEAISAARSFWKIYGNDKRPKPVFWLPCAKDDAEFGAIAIETEHIDDWRVRFPGANARKIVRDYRAELRRQKNKPSAVVVFSELEARLHVAAGVVLFDNFDWQGGAYAPPLEGGEYERASCTVENRRRADCHCGGH
jgi:hypothetical protein